VRFIDFGLVSSFYDKQGEHVKESADCEEFRGNLIFCSEDSLGSKHPSRRSDMQSLSFFMLYMIGEYTRVVDLYYRHHSNFQLLYKKMLALKQKQTI